MTRLGGGPGVRQQVRGMLKPVNQGWFKEVGAFVWLEREGRLAVMGIKLIVVVLLGATCTLAPCRAKGAERQLDMNRALEAPASELAQSYLWVRFMTQQMLPAAEKGVSIQLGSEAINKNNVEEYKRKYQERLSTYREAIKKRGYKTISGAYKGKATDACRRIQSAWAGLIGEGSASGIEISQDGFDAQVIISTEHQGQKLSLRNQAAIAESGIALQDEMNSDYFFRGALRPNEIEIKPDAAVLSSWPRWARPPSQMDLENCTITLEVLPDNGQEVKSKAAGSSGK